MSQCFVPIKSVVGVGDLISRSQIRILEVAHFFYYFEAHFLYLLLHFIELLFVAFLQVFAKRSLDSVTTDFF